MKKRFCLIFIGLIFLSLVAVYLFFIHPVYKNARAISERKSKLHIISKTESHAEIHLKNKIFAGNGAILPPQTLIVVGSTPLDVDMGDRTLVEFMPKTRFQIINEPTKDFSIKLLKGSLIFKKPAGKGGLKHIRSALGEIYLKGTEGSVSDTKVNIVSGQVNIDKTTDVRENQNYTDQGVSPIDHSEIQELLKALENLENSDQKSTWENFINYIPLFKEEIINNSALENKIQTDKPLEKDAADKPQDVTDTRDDEIDIMGYIMDIFKKKIDVYCDMYVLRLSITTDRYFNYDLSFPPSISSLNDEYASQITHDPWGTEYLYTVGGESGFNLRSAGPDTQMNTNDDIVLFTRDTSPMSYWQL